MIQKIPLMAYRFLRQDRSHFFTAARLCQKWANLASSEPLPASAKNFFNFVAGIEKRLSFLDFVETVEKFAAHRESWEETLVLSGKVICLASTCATVAAEKVFKEKFEFLRVLEGAATVSGFLLSARGIWKMGRKEPKTGFQYWQKGLSKILSILKVVGYSVFPRWVRVCLGTSLFATDFFNFACEKERT